MYPVSAAFIDALTGSHRVAVSVQILNTTQFGATPTGGVDLPILSGDVKLTAAADVKGTLDITVPGDYWDLLQPFGTELFVARGVALGNGTTELAPLGYYRIDEIDQDSAPYGPVRITGSDRTTQLQQNSVLFPYQPPAGMTHRELFQRLVNGDTGSGVSTEGYGMFIHNAVPITWTGYDPDTAIIPAGQVVADSVYDFLAKLAAVQGCQLRFTELGELSVEPIDVPDGDPVYAVVGGVNGTLVKASRTVSRKGTYNIISAYGSDPAFPTNYSLAYNNDANSALYWAGRFGAAPTFFASPLLHTGAATDAAAATVLARYTGVPTTLSVLAVPNPALRPQDIITTSLGPVLSTHVVDEVTIPLGGSDAIEIVTRTINTLAVTVGVDPIPDPTPDPTPDPGPGPGAPDPDGVQTATLLSWGAVIAGDEFEYTGAPLSSKWGLYSGAGNAGNGTRIPGAFTVTDGVMTCYGDASGATGGMALKFDQMYGRYEVRMRAYSVNPSAAGHKYHPVLILWPTSDLWPQGGEYDFAETDCDAGQMGSFMHYPGNDASHQLSTTKTGLDLQNWHNYAFEWHPSGLKAWIDGAPFFSYTDAALQAPGPMHFTFQLDNNYGSGMCPAKMESQWVRVYATG